MKNLRYTVILLFIGVLSTSCGNDAKKGANEMENASQTLKNADNVVDEASSMTDNIQQLRKKEHLTKEQWESWLPEKVLNMPIFNPQLNFMHGIGSCGATYREGNKRIRVMIIDGAGERGAGGVGPYRMSSKMDYDSEDQWGYTKSRIIDGVKVKESYRESGKSYNISMFYAERYAVDIETQDLPEESLEQIFNELNLSELLKLATQ